MKQAFSVTGMSCSACSAHVEKSVRKVQGVSSVSVNLLQNKMWVDFDDTVANEAAILAAVQSGGYGAYPIESQAKPNTPLPSPTQASAGKTASAHAMKMRLILSFSFLIPLFYLSMGHMMGWPLPSFFHGTENALILAYTQFLLTLPVLYCNRAYFSGGFRAIGRGAPNMDSLIALGSAAAVVYGVFAIYCIGFGLGHGDTALAARYAMDLYFESAAMILTLITCGKYLEQYSKGKTSQAIEKLMDLRPKTATLVQDGEQREVPIDEVRVGDVVLVRAGASVPVDGVVLQGEASVDESAITGESLPVDKIPGDTVTGATVSRSGVLHVRAEKVGEDTTLAQIVRLVEEAGGSKAPIQLLADRVSAVFVPIVLGIALLAGVIWYSAGEGIGFAVSIAIAVLVISCPCALGLATPTAIMVGTGRGAQNGMLIKSGESLQRTRRIDTVVLDKTGTLTEGKPRVTDVVPCAGVPEARLLALAAAAEQFSEHPLSRAVLELAAQRNHTPAPAEHFRTLPGRGVACEVEGAAVLAGNRKLMEESGVSLKDPAFDGERFAAQGKTPLYFALDGKPLGIIAVADVAKPTSRQAVREFEAMGIEVVMLTGDNARTAAAIAEQLGIRRTVSEVLPQDKEREVRRLQEEGRHVAMVGDGINDAPALMRADVGIAIGAGTDVAIESAGIVLMRGDLLDAVSAIQLSRAVMRNIKQNLFWAFFYNVIGIPLAAGLFYPLLGWKLNPMFGAAAMSLSSLCVVGNALRLRRFRPHFRFGAASQAVKPDMQPEQEVQSLPIKEEKTMKKRISIEGMMCANCVGHVKSALEALEGVAAAQVDLQEKSATVTLSRDVDDGVLLKAVTDAGYTAVSVTPVAEG